MNFGSLFAGIGGIDLGLERAGMECKWQVEIDDFCTKILEKHWPEVKRYRDVKEVHGVMAHTESDIRRTSGNERSETPDWRGSAIDNGCSFCLEPVDLIAGGFPCQPHSVAGKRRGKDDDRNLWPEYLRLIRKIRPRWVVGENVPGIVTTMLDDVLADLEGAGYTPTVFNIPAVAFGANHLRYRIFVIAHSERMGRQEGAGKGIQHEITKSKRPEFEHVCKVLSETANMADATGTGLEGQVTEGFNGRESGLLAECNWWSVESNVGRVAHGIPNRVDRLKSLGNAVVPQVAEFIGRCILEAEEKNGKS